MVEYKFSMSFSEDILAYEGEEVDVHVFKDEVDIPVVFSADYFFQLDDVGVWKLHEEHDLSIGPLRIGWVIERIEIFFKCLYFPCFFIGYFPDMSVGSAADLLVDVKPSKDVSLYFFTH